MAAEINRNRMKQLGFDSQKLIERLNFVTQDELKEAVKKYFALRNYAAEVELRPE